MRSASASGVPIARPVSSALSVLVMSQIDAASGSSSGPVNRAASGLRSCDVMLLFQQAPPTAGPRNQGWIHDVDDYFPYV